MSDETTVPLVNVDVKREQYAPIGRCIYCGNRKGLSREHIIPRSLAGEWVLQKASCETCADITKGFEQECARGMFGPHRLQFGYRSKNKRERPTHIPFTLKFQGEKREVMVPIDEAPFIPLQLPVFLLPSLIFPLPINGLAIRSWVWDPGTLIGDHKKRLDALQTKYPNTTFGFKNSFSPYAFMRLLAKIAHGAAIAVYGDMLETPLLPPYILGTNENIGEVVGSAPMIKPTPQKDAPFYLIRFRVQRQDGKEYLLAMIELFRYAYMEPRYVGEPLPPYCVIVGEANDQIKRALIPPGDREVQA